MKSRATFFFGLGLGPMLLLIVVTMAAVVLGGTLMLSRLARQRLDDEVRLRGSSLARGFALQFSDYLERGDRAMIGPLSDEILREDDLRYVILTDTDGTLLSSHSRLHWRPMTMPDELRASVCQTDDVIIRSRQIGHEELYNVAVCLRPAPGAHPSGEESRSARLGVLHLGLSLRELLEHQRSVQIWTWSISLFVVCSVVLVYIFFHVTVLHPLSLLSKIFQQAPRGEWLREFESLPAYGEVRILKNCLLKAVQQDEEKTDRLKQEQALIHTYAETLLSHNQDLGRTFEQQLRALDRLSALAVRNVRDFEGFHERAQSASEGSSGSLEAAAELKNAVGVTIDHTEGLREQVAANTDRIVVLGEKITQIGTVVNMIETIASQTKLIAVNASIEAAGAGDAGGRFSIVATEVRRLANTVVESVENIKEAVFSVQTATSELILSSETGLRKVNQGVSQIIAIRETLLRVGETMEKENLELNRLLESVSHQGREQQLIVNGLKDVSQQFEEALEEVKRSDEVVQGLGSLLKEME